MLNRISKYRPIHQYNSWQWKKIYSCLPVGRAYEIINRLNEQEDTKLLHQLNLAVEAKDRERNKKHEIWEDSFDWKECRTHKYMQQKLDYMHDNPCSGKWNLAAAPVDYHHSSVKFYITGEHAAYPVFNYLALDDIDLTKPLQIEAESTANTQGSA